MSPRSLARHPFLEELEGRSLPAPLIGVTLTGVVGSLVPTKIAVAAQPRSAEPTASPSAGPSPSAASETSATLTLQSATLQVTLQATLEFRQIAVRITETDVRPTTETRAPAAEAPGATPPDRTAPHAEAESVVVVPVVVPRVFLRLEQPVIVEAPPVRQVQELSPVVQPRLAKGLEVMQASRLTTASAFTGIVVPPFEVPEDREWIDWESSLRLLEALEQEPKLPSVPPPELPRFELLPPESPPPLPPPMSEEAEMPREEDAKADLPVPVDLVPDEELRAPALWMGGPLLALPAVQLLPAGEPRRKQPERLPEGPRLPEKKPSRR